VREYLASDRELAHRVGPPGSEADWRVSLPLAARQLPAPVCLSGLSSILVSAALHIYVQYAAKQWL